MIGYSEQKMFKRSVIPTIDVNEPIAITNSTSSLVYYSLDGFETYNTYTSSSSSPTYSVSMNGVLFIVNSNGICNFTVNNGTTWKSYSSYSGLPSASEGGKYIILPGNSAGSTKHKLSINYGDTFTTLPSNIYYNNGVYCGTNSWINKNGTSAIVSCRSMGLGYSISLDTNSWGLHPRGSTNFPDIDGHGHIFSDTIGWSFLGSSWGNGVLFNYTGNVTSFTALPQNFTVSSTYMKDGIIYYSTPTGIFKYNYGSTTQTQISNINSLMLFYRNNVIFYDRVSSLEIYVNHTLLTNIQKNTNSQYNQIYQTKNGRLIVLANNNRLMISDDDGLTWINKTGNMSIDTNSKISKFKQ